MNKGNSNEVSIYRGGAGHKWMFELAICIHACIFAAIEC